ncbi:MAG: amino acid racemase [Clostridia bacterium]|nr:amino acid racemase [Clostridia bacterium]
MALLGVIGGLGPLATAYFMELITVMTDAEKDQQHLKMVIYSDPEIPDRTDYILGKSDKSPLPGFASAGKALQSLGCDVLAIPCITAHCFHEQIEAASGVETLHAIRDTALLLKQAGIKKAGLMATDGTVQSRVFQNELEKNGIEVVLPSESAQKDVMALIYRDIKCGRAPDMDAFFRVKSELSANGAQAVLLGCTELSLIKRSNDTGKCILDVMEVLARSAILKCGKPLRTEYEKLI